MMKELKYSHQLLVFLSLLYLSLKVILQCKNFLEEDKVFELLSFMTFEPIALVNCGDNNSGYFGLLHERIPSYLHQVFI